MTTFADLQSKLSSCVLDKDLRLQVKQTSSQLSIVINRPTHNPTVDYDAIADVLTATVRALDVPTINAVKLYGRSVNSKQVEWQRFESLMFEADSAATDQLSPAAPRTVEIKPKPQPSKPQPSKPQPSKLKTAREQVSEQISRHANVISAAALLGLLFLGLNTVVGQKPQATVWEYKIESVKDDIFTDSMDQLGKEGWELVFARRAKEASSSDFAYECIFKRVKK